MTHPAAILIPAYRESARLPALLDAIRVAKTAIPAGTAIRILDDGSPEPDSTAMRAAVEALARDVAPIEVAFIRFPRNRGKGATLRDGFRAALAEGFAVIAFLDADGSTPFAELLAVLARMEADPALDAVIASRVKMLGKSVHRSLARHLLGRVFATALSVLLDIPVYDSQCGCKAFRARALGGDTLDLCDDDRWLFDTQLVITLQKRGFAIVEHPVSWSEIPGSKVSLLRDPIVMLAGMLRIRARFRRY